MDLMDRRDRHESCDAYVEQAVKLLAPEEEASELISNTLAAVQAFQRRQEMEWDTLLAFMPH
jgi:hypothetical protein